MFDPYTGLAPNSRGGTETMFHRLHEEFKEIRSLDDHQIICSRVGELDDRPYKTLWLHDMAGDPNAVKAIDLEAPHRNKINSIIFVSHSQLEDYRRLYPLTIRAQINKIMVIENFLPLRLINAASDLKFQDQDRVIRCIYHTTPHRGLEHVIDVWPKIYAAFGGNVRLDVYSSFSIYGWKENDAPYEPLFGKIKNMEGVFYHGAVDHSIVMNTLKNADFFLFPSIWKETSCLALMEACSFGVWPISINLGSIHETACGYGKLYHNADEWKIGVVDEMKRYLSLPKEVKINMAMSANGINYARRNLSIGKWGMMFDALEAR